MGVAMSDFESNTPESEDSDSLELEAFSTGYCPVTQCAKNALLASKETQHALRQLRQSLLNCEICPAFKQCELREDFNLQIDIAIAEINEEWGW
jgi:hypothetical protein